MSRLILVKHAAPKIHPEVVSHKWVLSEGGRHRCEWLARELRAQGVSRLCSSLEPKALETAALVAVRLNLPVEPCPDLHENDRTGLGFVTADELRRRMRDFFDQPYQVIMGAEAADSALRRFARSTENIVAKQNGNAVAIVTHGTVLSLFVAHHNPIGAFDLWSQLGLPSYLVLNAGSFALEGPVRNYPDQP